MDQREIAIPHANYNFKLWKENLKLSYYKILY